MREKIEAFEWLYKHRISEICCPSEGNKKKAEGCFNAVNDYGKDPTEENCKKCWFEYLYGKLESDYVELQQCNKLLAEVNLNNAGKIKKLKQQIEECKIENGQLMVLLSNQEKEIESLKCCGNCSLMFISSYPEGIPECRSCNDRNKWSLKE